MTAGLDHHDGLDARGGARSRHEFARVVDRLDVKQNRPSRAVEREKIEQVAEIDVDLVPERDGRRETDVMRCRPLDKAGGDGTGLRDEASSPAGGMRAAKLALSLARDDKTPRQFGPTSLRPLARAAFSQASASEPSPCPRPAVMMIAVATPFSPAAATMPGTDRGGAAITMRSGACRSSWMVLTALIPSISP
jgi:hypothetical protein